ncbi:MAG: hypothetical protein KAX80_01020 [Planctomycetes bacterium]|nr:hypothetical protein [Planctomycetota bacterium]
MKGALLLLGEYAVPVRNLWKVALLGLSAAVLAALPVEDTVAEEVGVVSNVKVVSDKVEDVSSIEAWKASFIKPGMTDREKGLAVWETCVKFRHQENPPREFLQASGTVQDPIKTFNVYGYGMCSCVSSNVEALARAAGLKARGRIISHHSVPEVWWDGDWHLLDASLICYFLDEGGDIASVDEIMASLAEWYKEHPELKSNDAGLRQFTRNWGWKKGPPMLAASEFYSQNGWLPAGTHGWYSTMQEYDGSANGIYEYGYSQGYRVNVQLREGEVITRNWSNKGLHVNMDLDGNVPGCLTRVVGEGDLGYAPKYGDIAPGRIGNGTHVYGVPLASGAARAGALRYENLASTADDQQGPALHVKSGEQSGVLELRMPSSYVYLGGSMSGTFVVGEGGGLRVFLSRNNGLDWQEIFAKTDPGRSEQTIDLKPLVYRLYDYRLKFELTGEGTGLDALKIEHDIQNSQRALPALGAGENTITFSAAPASEGTITIEGRTTPQTKGNQLVALEFHPTFEGVESMEHGILMTGGKGWVTFPIETPGDMVRLRLGTHYRARDARDGWDYLVSFDDGKTWEKVGRAAGPFPGNGEYVTFEDVPEGTRKALVRFQGTQRNTTLIMDLRIDADYLEPAGGFRPVRVTYVWEEGGVEKQHEHMATKPQETYTITCGDAPVMRTFTVELAE